MKDNLEKVFKEKLDQFEAPYDASAWESMNSRLDAQQGAGGNNTLKWIAGSAAVLAVLTVATYYFTNNESSTTAHQAEVHTKNTVDQSQPEADVKSSEEKENIEKTTPATVSTAKEDATNNVEHPVSPDNDNEEISNVINQQDETNNEELTADENKSNTNKVDDHLQNVQSKGGNNGESGVNYIAGTLMNNKVCKGESIFIRNSGAKDDIMKVQLDGQILTLKKAHAHEFTPEQSGTLLFLDGENNVLDKKKYIVFENPNPEFNYKANIFDKGLPVTECETYGDYQSVEWTFDEEFKAKGRKTTHNFFKKGDHSVSLTVEDFNGCKNTLTKTVRIDENYNLMAVSAFTPYDNNRLNSTFMPFALTKRDVSFTLTIVDPRDNSVVFTSQDASKGWDGKDQRTGKMAPKESIYIWKVQLESNIPNERNVYAGTIQVM